MRPVTNEFIDELKEIVGEVNVLTPSARLSRNSLDCFWYSPVLKPMLENKSAEVMVSPATQAELVAVIAAAVRAGVPITPRGAGTGNYGQSIPIYGGLLISTKRMNNILEVTPEFAHVEAGVILHQVELRARQVGAEMRFFPSTLPTSTAAGFVVGGSAGIGSIKWGNVWDPGNILNATVITIEAEPQILTLSDPEALQGIIHSCGLTAIISDLTFALAPRQPWQQYVVAFDNFEDALRLGYDLAKDDHLLTRLVSVVEWPAPSFFIQLANENACPEGKSILLLHVPLNPDEFQPYLEGTNGEVTWHSPQTNIHRGAVELSDFAWNHTTLWAMKADPTFTYSQEGFHPEQVFDQLRQRKAKYGDSVVEHITFSRSGGKLRPTGLPLIRFQSEEHLNELMDYCESIGILQYSPHTTYLDDDKYWEGQPILNAKAKWDPHGLLNPGHLRSQPIS